MSDTPERIWLHGFSDDLQKGKPARHWEYQDYIRADLAEASATERKAGTVGERVSNWLGLALLALLAAAILDTWIQTRETNRFIEKIVEATTADENPR